MTALVKRVCANMAGRDFIVGDIHGAFDLVIQGMRAARFNREIDRLFVAGDLIDRGPGSHRVLGFLQQPYVHAIRGNHDHDFCTLNVDAMRLLGGIDWNGLGWTKDQTDEHLLAIRDKLGGLPIAMEIETPRGLVGLVHADVPQGMTWQEFTLAVEAGDEAVIEVALCGRDRIQSRDESGVLGIGRLFVGHTIQWSGAMRLGNVIAVDTGAVFRELGKEKGALTMANVACGTGVLVGRPLDEAVVVHAEAADGPFGRYARADSPRF